jgi:predicted nucleic acid-binding protein
MASAYIETTIPSFYFETRTSARIAAWRAATRAWWSTDRSRYQLSTSTFVLNELAMAPTRKSASCLALLDGVRVLPEHAKIQQVVREYIRRKLMHADAVGDAAHLAMCSLYGIDFLLTWNCRHLANANKVPHIRAVNERLGLFVPTLTTPFELIAEDA